MGVLGKRMQGSVNSALAGIGLGSTSFFHVGIYVHVCVHKCKG